jgi:hypothetical protein
MVRVRTLLRPGEQRSQLAFSYRFPGNLSDSSAFDDAISGRIASLAPRER